MEFVDDYRLLVNLRSSGDDDIPYVVLIDTEGGDPVETSFHLPPYFRGSDPSLLLERGIHEPSSAECLAPFHQDRTQRIAVLSMPYPSGHIVFPVEALLKLAKGREGCEIGWDEWKRHALIPSIPTDELALSCVSGCRLFSINSENHSDIEIEVYDFSMQGRAKYLGDRVNMDLGGVRYLVSTGTIAKLPRGDDDLYDVSGGHDSVLFFRVSVLLFSCAMKLSDVAQILDVSAEDVEGVFDIWSF